MPKDGKKTLRIETDFVLQHIEADRELKWKREISGTENRYTLSDAHLYSSQKPVFSPKH